MQKMTLEQFREHAEAIARGEIPKKKPATTTPKPKAQPKPKVKARPKAKRVTAATLDATERRLDRIERSTITTWAAAVAYITKRDGCTRAAAGEKACKEFPTLHPARRAK